MLQPHPPGGLSPKFDPKESEVVTIPFCGKGDLIVGGHYPLPEQQAEPALLASRCEKFFKEEVKEPFFLRVSIIVPHTPVLASLPFYGTTERQKIRVPDGSEDELHSKPLYEQNCLPKYHPFHIFSDEELTRARGTYYDLCFQVDEAIRSIINSLTEHGYGENIVIVFTADYGTLLGEHGLGQKCTFYEPVIRVPLIISFAEWLPRSAIVEDPIQLIDLMPTVLRLCGIELPKKIAGRIHGRDLTPQMLGETGLPDRPVYSELDHSRSQYPVRRPYGSHRAMIRTRRWKLAFSLCDADYGEDGELYDLQRDPYEMRNFYRRPEYKGVVEELKQSILDWQRRTKASQ